MKTLLRFWTALLICSALVFLLFGCNSSSSDPAGGLDAKDGFESQPPTRMSAQEEIEEHAVSKCREGADSDWAAEFAESIERNGKLYRSLERELGPPDTCSGGAESVYEGRTYGYVQYGWSEGFELTVQTQPLSTVIRTISAPSGFTRPQVVRGLVRDFADASNFAIDWTEPDVGRRGATTIEEYVGKHRGDNAIVRFLMEDEQLVKASASRAP